MGIIDLKAENARLLLLDRQACGGCGEPLCKDITLCRVCVDKILAENTKLRNLLNLALTALKSRGICGECKHYTGNHKQGLCADCYYDTAHSPCQMEYLSNRWTWKHSDML